MSFGRLPAIPTGNRKKVNPLPPGWQREPNRWHGTTPPLLLPQKEQRKTDNHFGPTWPEVTKRRFLIMEKDNYLNNAELSTEQNYNMIDGIPNNAPLPIVQAMPEERPKDRVKEPPAKRRSREREER